MKRIGIAVGLAVVALVSAGVLAVQSPARAPVAAPSPGAPSARGTSSVEQAPDRVAPRAPVGPPPMPAVGAAESPTGRRPKAIWTPQRQALWERLSQQGNADWANAMRAADATGTKSSRYADLGQWATVAYQLTGNPYFAGKAWSRIAPKMGKRPPNRNFTREHLIEYAWMYDWLKPALGPEQRQQYVATMNEWCRLALNQVSGVSFGTRVSDSDELVGHYFGLALWAAVSGDENSEALTYLKDRKVGGYEATAVDRKTWRNAIGYSVRSARGGIWLESSKYNLGTLRLLFFGAEALRTATGREHFPEIAALADEVAAAQVHELTSDLRQAFQWGDEENPRSLHMDRRAPLLALLSGVARSEDAAGWALELLQELPGGEIPPRELVLYNPARPPRSWRTQPTQYAAEGMGFVFARDSWRPDGSFFGAYMANRVGVDHEVRYFGNFQLYRGGEWVVTHPLGYDAYNAEHINGMLLGGWSSAREARRLIGHGTGPDGIVYVLGATGGHPYAPGADDPSPYFLHEWTRSLVYVPGRDGRADLIIVHDRTLVQDPRSLPGYDRYHERDHKRMERELARGLKQWIVHMPMPPQIQGRVISWRTFGGQPVTVTTLLPERVTYQALDERRDVSLGRYVREDERGWQVRVIPAQAQEWDTFLHVIQAGPGPVDVRLVREGAKEGVTISRPGQPTRTVLFNAAPGKRLTGPKTSSGKLVANPEVLNRYKALAQVEIR